VANAGWWSLRGVWMAGILAAYVGLRRRADAVTTESLRAGLEE
jgi:hypothetical protein